MKIFFVQFFCVFLPPLLLSSASVRSLLFLTFIVPFFAWNVPLVSLILLKRFLVFPIYLSIYNLSINQLSIHLSPIYLSIIYHPSLYHLSIYLSIIYHPSIYHPSISLLSISLYHLSIIHLSIHLSIYLLSSIYPLIYLMEPQYMQTPWRVLESPVSPLSQPHETLCPQLTSPLCPVSYPPFYTKFRRALRKELKVIVRIPCFLSPRGRSSEMPVVQCLKTVVSSTLSCLLGFLGGG